MKILLIIIWLLCSCTFISAKAEIYEYIDEAGISNLSDIQVDDRYQLIQSSTNSITGTPTLTSEDLTIKNSAHINSDQQKILSYIEKSAKNYQIDSELIYAVIHVESAFRIRAKSSKGAQGLMQLMPATANRLGIKDSYDPAQNIEGGAKYLKELIALFKGDIPLAIAAYNAGENAVIRYGRRIPPYKETQAYVPKVLAIYNSLLSQRKSFSY